MATRKSKITTKTKPAHAPAPGKARPRQRLLYLTCSGMSTLSPVVASDLREPTRKPNVTKLSPEPKMLYNSVHDAIVDGWRVIVFPTRDAPVDDREVNVWGYQFILEKLEHYDD